MGKQMNKAEINKAEINKAEINKAEINNAEIKNQLEINILGCIITEPENLPVIYQKIKPEDFSDSNRELYQYLLEIDFSKITDSNLLMLKLMEKKMDSWKVSDLFDLQKREVTYDFIIGNEILERFVDIKNSLTVEDFLKTKLAEAKESIFGVDLLSDLSDECNQQISKIGQSLKVEKPFDVIKVISQIEDELSSGKSNSFNTLSFPSFNNATGGINPGNLVSIAGSYKSGKTTFGLNLILDFVKQGISCGFFSLELSEDELNRKILGMLSGLPYDRLREPKKLLQSEKSILTKVAQNQKDLPLYISDKRMTENEIKAKSKYWRDKFGVRLVIIDYVGYISSKQKFPNRERELSSYSEYLKGLAKELNLVVITLAQLNRNGRLAPGTENLAESIALARDSDFLFTIFNPTTTGTKNSSGTPFSESDFIVKLDASRHSKNGKSFILSLSDDGIFAEKSSQYDNHYVYTKKESGSLLPPELAKYVQQKEIF